MFDFKGLPIPFFKLIFPLVFLTVQSQSMSKIALLVSSNANRKI